MIRQSREGKCAVTGGNRNPSFGSVHRNAAAVSGFVCRWQGRNESQKSEASTEASQWAAPEVWRELNEGMFWPEGRGMIFDNRIDLTGNYKLQTTLSRKKYAAAGARRGCVGAAEAASA